VKTAGISAKTNSQIDQGITPEKPPKDPQSRNQAQLLILMRDQAIVLLLPCHRFVPGG